MEFAKNGRARTESFATLSPRGSARLRLVTTPRRVTLLLNCSLDLCCYSWVGAEVVTPSLLAPLGATDGQANGPDPYTLFLLSSQYSWVGTEVVKRA